jgi:hypothetical protein
LTDFGSACEARWAELSPSVASKGRKGSTVSPLLEPSV